jgi:peptide subunit release factor RF-3
MKATLVRTAKQMPLTAPQFFFARSRITADEAYAGDVVGIPNHGTLRIGDTLTEGEEIVFRGVPNFAPEILRRVRLGDPMKAKKLKEALQQMAEEGVVQLFSPEDGSPAIVGVVGALQLDVLKERLKIEYGLPVDFEMARFSVCRWIAAGSAAELDRFIETHRGDIAPDHDGDLEGDLFHRDQGLSDALIAFRSMFLRARPERSAFREIMFRRRVEGRQMAGPATRGRICLNRIVAGNYFLRDRLGTRS